MESPIGKRNRHFISIEALLEPATKLSGHSPLFQRQGLEPDFDDQGGVGELI